MPHHTRHALTEARIANLFLRALNVEVPSKSFDLFESAALDSMAFVELLVALEQAFGVRVSLDDMELEEFRSIDRIAALINRKLAAPAGSGCSAQVSLSCGRSVAGTGERAWRGPPCRPVPSSIRPSAVFQAIHIAL